RHYIACFKGKISFFSIPNKILYCLIYIQFYFDSLDFSQFCYPLSQPVQAGKVSRIPNCFCEAMYKSQRAQIFFIYP
ncbi:MAG: hypothetical protein K9H16_13835, partial [Bacteroidales bacterium]|nr:hypothetical protein [Bacteroidales bacterium]